VSNLLFPVTCPDISIGSIYYGFVFVFIFIFLFCFVIIIIMYIHIIKKNYNIIFCCFYFILSRRKTNSCKFIVMYQIVYDIIISIIVNYCSCNKQVPGAIIVTFTGIVCIIIITLNVVVYNVLLWRFFRKYILRNI